MRARRHHWIPTAIAATFVVTIGCRGGKPLGDLVQVTGGPSASEVPDVEPPPQRLATARPQAAAASDKQPSSSRSGNRRSPSETTSSLASAPARRVADSSGRRIGDDSSGKEKDDSSAEKTADEKMASTADQDESGLAAGSSSADAMMKNIEAALEARGDGSAEKTAASSSNQPNAESDSGETASAESAEKSLAERAAKQLAALPETQRSELLKALGDSPPEVQQQAVRQLVAILARDADPTDSPSGIDQALQHSLDDLPELTETSGSDGGPKPTRLAAAPAAADNTAASDGSKPGSSAQRITLSDQTDDRSGQPADTSETDAVALAQAPSSSGSVARAVGTESAVDAAAGDAVQQASATEPADESGAGAAAQAATSSEPAAAPGAQLSDRQLYEMLLARLSEPVEGESEADRSRRKIMARHLMVLAGDPDRAVEGIEGLGEKEQEYLRHQLLGLWTIIDPKGHPVPGRRFTTALPQLREATNYLAAATDTLEVRSLAFCTETVAYGQVKKFPSDRFRSGQRVLFYYEVENFTADRVDEGYETHLQGSYDVYDDQDRKVASQLLPADRQVSNNLIRDYWIAIDMHLPQLDPGKYRCQLTVEDVNGKKYGQASIDFEIGE